MGAAPQRAAASSPHYERRRPEQTPLYRLVRQHYESFAAEVDNAGGAGLPQFVKDEFAAYLDCGILAHGFLRLTCDGCARDTLVAFSGSAIARAGVLIGRKAAAFDGARD